MPFTSSMMFVPPTARKGAAAGGFRDDSHVRPDGGYYGSTPLDALLGRIRLMSLVDSANEPRQHLLVSPPGLCGQPKMDRSVRIC